MRTITAAQQAVLDSGNQSEHVRVSIKDAGGTFRDLTTYPGFNAVKAVTWSEEVEGPHMTFDCVLLREMNRLSLAPFLSTSPLNKGFDPAAAYAPLIALNREVTIETAIVSMDRQPASGDWMEVFRGRVDELDTASAWNVKIGGRGKAGRLAQQFIKTELVYSHASVGGVAKPLRVWEPQIPVVLNVTYCLPASRGAGAGTTPADPGYNKFFKCSQSGTTGTSEPTWSTGTNIADGTAKWDYVAAPTTAGTPVEQVMQNLLDDHKAASDSAVTLYTPASPSWAIRQFIQQREFVLDAVRALAGQIGWDLRYKWREATSQFEFTFLAPTRSSPSVNFTFAAADYLNPTRLSVNIASIRNSWRIVYSDRADLWPDGSAKRKVIEVSDPTSIAKYEELWAEIQEDENSQVDSSTEATTLINAALSDTKEPTAELGITLARGFPWVELNDYYTFTANNLHFDSNQSLAVTKWTQSYEAGKKLQTTLEVRGLPTVGAGVWLARTVHPKNPGRNRPSQLVHYDGPTTQSPTLRQEPGGFTLALASQHDKARLPEDEAEIHIYEAPSTALSDATLQAITKGQATKSFADLVPGKTYYGRIVPRWYSKGKLIRGQPSAEFSIVAGRASAGHLDSQVIMQGPPNGKFQHALDDLATAPPDHWAVTVGTWDEGDDLFHATTTANGRHVVFGQTATAQATLRSGAWPIPRGATRAKLLATVRPQGTLSAGRNLQFHVDFFAEETLTTSTGDADVSAPYDIAAANTWADFSTDIDIPAGSNFARISVFKETTSSAYGFDLAGVYLQPAVPLAQEAWIEVAGGVGFQNSFSDFNTAGWPACAYMKDSLGFVHLRGMAKRATAALLTAIFTLPDGYRPAKELNFAAQGKEGFCRLRISAAGVVDIATATDANWFEYFSLEGFTFDTR